VEVLWRILVEVPFTEIRDLAYESTAGAPCSSIGLAFEALV